jgi:transcriptional regulator with XRE-family HTH domain
MEVRRRVALNIKKPRTARGISQEELAERAGVHRTYISGVERGVRNPTLTVLDKIANRLGAPLTELVSGD